MSALIAGVADFKAHGEYRTIDLLPLDYARVRPGTPFREAAVF